MSSITPPKRKDNGQDSIAATVQPVPKKNSSAVLIPTNSAIYHFLCNQERDRDAASKQSAQPLKQTSPAVESSPNSSIASTRTITNITPIASKASETAKEMAHVFQLTSMDTVRSLIAADKFQEAYNMLEKLRNPDPHNSSEFYALHGDCLVNLKQYGMAFMSYDLAETVATDPEEQAKFSKKKKEIKDKIEYLPSISVANAAKSSSEAVTAAKKFIDNNDFLNAYKELEKVSSVEPKQSSEFYALQGCCLDNLKKYAPALICYQRAASIETNPEKKSELSKKAVEVQAKLTQSTPIPVPKKKPKKSTSKAPSTTSRPKKQANVDTENFIDLSTTQNSPDQDKGLETIDSQSNIGLRTTTITASKQTEAISNSPHDPTKEAYVAELTKAQKLCDQGNFQEALDTLKALEDLESWSVRASLVELKPHYLTCLGDCLQGLGKHTSAIEQYNKAGTFEKDSHKPAELLYKLAVSQKALKRYLEAGSHINKALKNQNISDEQKARFLAFKERILPEQELPEQEPKNVVSLADEVEASQSYESHLDEPGNPNEDNEIANPLLDLNHPSTEQVADQTFSTIQTLTDPDFEASFDFSPEQQTNNHDNQFTDSVATLANSVKWVVERNPLFSNASPPSIFGQLPQFASPDFELTTTANDPIDYDYNHPTEEMPTQNSSLASHKEPAEFIDLPTRKFTPTESRNLIPFPELIPTAFSSAKAALQAHEAKLQVQKCLKEGRDYFNSSELQKAVDCFKEGLNFINLADDPQLSVELLYLLGTAQLQLKNSEECKTAWLQCIPLISKEDLNFKAHLIRLLASLHIQDNELEATEKLYQLAIDTEFPKDDEKNALLLALADLIYPENG